MNRLILGCGYLGQRVAERWRQPGDNVFAVTRTDEQASTFERWGLQPVVADVTMPSSLKQLRALPTIDTLLFAVGMDRSRYSDIRDVYVQGLRNVLSTLSLANGDGKDTISSESQMTPRDADIHLIYISSTGVYGDFGGDWIDESAETDPQREGGKACLAAERWILESGWGQRATILRFAGIYGPDRVPTADKLQQKQWSQLSADGFLNLIHVDDGVGIVCRVANETPSGDIYHVSDGQPPRRRDYYDFLAQQLGVGDIPWDPSASAPAESRAANSKRVSNKKLVRRYDPTFRFPDFRSGIVDALKTQ